MVVQHTGQDILQEVDVLEYVVSNPGVTLDELELGLGKLAGLPEHGFRHADLAYIVHQPCDPHPLCLCVVHTASSCKLRAEQRHPLGVTKGVRVFGIDRGCKRLQRS